MHALGNFAVDGNVKRPYVAVVALDSSYAPIYALTQESEETVEYVRISGQVIPTHALLDNVEHAVTRPQSGGGMIRRTVSISVKTDEAKGSPFFKDVFTKKFYQGGQTYNELLFAVYANDLSHYTEDIEKGWFLGVYRIDLSIDWKETDGTTEIPLLQIFEADTTKVGATEEDIPEQFFLFNPWYQEPIVPKVFGRVPRIRMLNIFPSVSVKEIAGSVSGTIQSAYTNVSASIVLEKYADQNSVLRQLITIGGTVAVRMHDGEVIVGSLAYNTSTHEVTLTVTARNQPYATGRAYTYAPGEDFSTWSNTSPAFGGGYLPAAWSMVASVILNGRNIIQDTNGFMKAELNYFDDAAFNNNVAQDTVVELNGWHDENRNIINHTQFEYSTYPPTVLSAYFSNSSRSAGEWPPISYTSPWSQYVYFSTVTKAVSFYFNNPDTSSAGSGSVGDPWSIVNIYPASVEYKCYIRNGFSKFSNNHVYAEGDGRLIKIPTANIVSVTQSMTKFGIAGLAEIVLNMAPIDMDIGAKSNVVYVDALFKDGANEARTERIILEVLKESAVLEHYAGLSLSSYYTTNWLPYVGVLVREAEELSAVLDQLLYECGITFEWQADKFEIRKVAMNHSVYDTRTIASVDYVAPLLPVFDSNELLEENSAAIKTGELISIIKDGKEVIPLYYDADYGSWEDPFYKRVKSASNRAIKPKDFQFAYHFKYIHDASSAAHAIGMSLCVGHASGLYMVNRYLSGGLISDGFKYDVLDAVVLNNFPVISDENTDAIFDGDQICYEGTGHFIMGAVCCVDSLNYAFAVDAPVRAEITFKQAQLFVNARGVSVYNPPYPPLEPGDPPGPDQPPGGGSGSNASAGDFGGWYSPMLASWTQPASIEINSTATEESPFTLTVMGDFIHEAGWTYYFTIEGLAGVPEILPGAATISGDASGAFADKENDAYVPGVKNLVLEVNYLWFQNQPPQLISRALKLTLHKVIMTSKFGGEVYEETESKIVQVIIKDVVDIVAT